MDVLLLTQATCTACKRVEALLARLAAEYPLSIAVLDLDAPEGRALAERGGVLFAPGVFLDGEAIADGQLSERRLRREIERRLGQVSASRSGFGKIRRGIERRLRLTEDR